MSANVPLVFVTAAVTVKNSVWPGPAVMPVRGTVTAAAFSRSVKLLGLVGLLGFVIGSSVGAWLTAPTSTLKLWLTEFWPPLAVPPLLVTVTVIVARPKVLSAGVKVSVPVVLGLL